LVNVGFLNRSTRARGFEPLLQPVEEDVAAGLEMSSKPIVRP
jgi:hypothetical protein